MTVPRPPRPFWIASGKLAKNEDQAAFELSWLSANGATKPQLWLTTSKLRCCAIDWTIAASVVRPMISTPVIDAPNATPTVPIPSFSAAITPATAVFGVTYRGRILPDAIDEDVPARIIVVVEIVMRVLDFIVENADMDAAAVIVVPDRRNVDIDAGSSAQLAGVAQVPLIIEQRIGGHIVGSWVDRLRGGWHIPARHSRGGQQFVVRYLAGGRGGVTVLPLCIRIARDARRCFSGCRRRRVVAVVQTGHGRALS